MAPRTLEQNSQIRDERRLQILEVAAGVFARHGLDATRMGQVAQAASISNGLVYHYFPSKEELYHQVVALALDRASAAYAQVLALPGPAIEVLGSLLKAMLPQAYAPGRREFFQIINQALSLQGIPGQTRALLQERIPAQCAALLPLFERGHADGSIRLGSAAAQVGLLSALFQGLALIGSDEYRTARFFPDAEALLDLFRSRP